MSILGLAIIYLIGAITFMHGGYRLFRWILVRPKSTDNPMKPHLLRDTFVSVGGSMIGIAAWTYIFIVCIVEFRIRMYPGAG